MKVKKWQGVGLAVVVATLVLIVAGIALKPLIREQVNLWRSDRLMTRAQAAFAEEDWEAASRLGRAAHFLTPGKQAPKVLLARAQLRQRLPTAVGWWKRVIEDPSVPLDDLREITELLLSTQAQKETALTFLARLVERDSGSEATRLLWLRGLGIQHRYATALALAREFIKDDSESWEMHRAYLQLLDQVKGTAGRSEITGHLRKLAQGQGELSLKAARDLVALDFAKTETKIRAARLLLEKATAPMDVLYARGLLVQEEEVDFSALSPKLEELLTAPQEGFLEELLSWSHWMGRSDWFLSQVTWKQYRNNGGTFAPWLKLLIVNEEYERVLTRTASFATHKEGEKGILFYTRSLAFEKLGQPERADSLLRLATEIFEPEELPQLEAILAEEGRWRALLALHENLAASSETTPEVTYNLLIDHYHLGNDLEVMRLLRELPEKEPDHLANQPSRLGFILYLRIVFEGVDSALHSKLEHLLAEEPELLDFRVLTGLSHLISGRSEHARAFMEGLPKFRQDAARHLRVASILMGASETSLFPVPEEEALLQRESMLLKQVRKMRTSGNG